MSRSIYVAGLWLLLTAAIGCAARRDQTPDGQLQVHQPTVEAYENALPHTPSQQTADQQADAATESIGDRPEVRGEARQAAAVLKGLLGLVLQLPHSNPKVVSGLTRDVAQLSSGLDAIADSRNDQEFTAAVFDMCEPEPLQASGRIGPLLIGLGVRIRTNPPANAPPDQVRGWAQYFDRLGETLVRIPRQCHLAREGIAQVKGQVLAEHESQSRAPRIEARRHHEATMILLCIAGGMLAPSPNRYPIGVGARLGRGLEQCQ